MNPIHERLKNLACGYEGSAAVLSLSRDDADVLIPVSEATGKPLDSLYVEPATITGAQLCELVERLNAPEAEEPVKLPPVVPVVAPQPHKKPPHKK